MNEQRTDGVTQIIGGMEDLTKILWSATALLAPWLVPLAPAAFFGWVMYQTATRADMPELLAMIVGFVAALGLEAVNIAAAHAAVQLSHNREEHRWKFALAIGLVIFYVIIGITSMLLLNADWNVKIVGAAMFLLAPVAITAQALTMDLVWTREDAEAEATKEAEATALQIQWDYEYKIKLAELRWQHKTDVAIADRTPDRTVTAPVRKWSDKWSFMADPDRTQYTANQVKELAGVTDRTARRWVADARNGNES